MTATTAPPPSIGDLVRELLARLSPQARQKLAALAAAAGVGLGAYFLSLLLGAGPIAGLLISVVLTTLLEPWLLTQLLTVLL